MPRSTHEGVIAGQPEVTEEIITILASMDDIVYSNAKRGVKSIALKCKKQKRRTVALVLGRAVAFRVKNIVSLGESEETGAA